MNAKKVLLQYSCRSLARRGLVAVGGIEKWKLVLSHPFCFAEETQASGHRQCSNGWVGKAFKMWLLPPSPLLPSPAALCQSLSLKLVLPAYYTPGATIIIAIQLGKGARGCWLARNCGRRVKFETAVEELRLSSARLLDPWGDTHCTASILHWMCAGTYITLLERPVMITG